MRSDAEPTAAARPEHARGAPPSPTSQRWAHAVLGALDTVLGALAVTAIASLIVIVFANVVGRYVFEASLTWSLEAAQWLFIAVILIGVPLAHRTRTHLLITVLVDRLPRRERLFAAFLSDVIVACTTIMLLLGGWTLISVMGGTNVALGLPAWGRFVPIPVSCAIGLLYVALRGFDEGEARWRGPLAILAGAGLAFVMTETSIPANTSMAPGLVMALAFAFAMILATPVAFAMLFAVFLANEAGAMLPPAAVVQNLVNGASKFLLLAIPFFITAGALMNVGGITTRLIDFAAALVGHLRGGLAHVNVVTSGLYAGISGSSYSDAAVGTKLLVPQMVARGYPAPFACAVTAASATLPNVIPPSIALLILAAVANLSVGSLWIAGIVPGLVMAGFLMVAIAVIARRRGYDADATRASRKVLGRTFLRALPALALAILILGGIRLGIVTPTEAGVLAVVYAFALGMLYRAYDLRTLYWTVRTSAMEAALVGLLIGAATPFAFVLVSEQIPQTIAQAMAAVAGNWILALILANITLLLFGMFLDIGAAILILTPLLMPGLVAFGIDPIHIGIIIVVNLMLGGLTPPVGMLAFITGAMSNTPVHQVFAALVPFIAVLVLAVTVITFVPALSLGLGAIFAAL